MSVHAASTMVLTAVSNSSFNLAAHRRRVLLSSAYGFLNRGLFARFLRPSVMSWSFYVFAVGYFGTGPAYMYWSHVISPPAYPVLAFVLSTVFGPWSVLPLLAVSVAVPRR